MAASRPVSTAPIYRKPGIRDVEDLEGYAPGGYYPIDIFGKVDNPPETYTVLHKLGFGPSSTVWLVLRECEGSDKQTLHALKILRADLSARGQHLELQVIQRLEQAGWGCNAHPSLIQIQSWFTVDSANGQHLCLVLPLLGPSLDNFRARRAMDGKTRRGVCEQLAHAVNYLHAFGFCHSDLSPSNVLFKIPVTLQSIALYYQLDSPVSEEIRLADGGTPLKHSPREVVRPTTFSGLPFYELKDIVIISFGKAFPEYAPPPTLNCPMEIFPPELLFGYPPSEKSDIWQLACLMYKVHTTRDFPFETDSSYEMLVWHIARYMGPIPSHWRGKYRWDRYRTLSALDKDASGGLNGWYDKSQATESLETRLEDREHLCHPEQKPFREKMAGLIGDMLAWEPDLRPSSGAVYKRVLEIGQVAVDLHPTTGSGSGWVIRGQGEARPLF